MIGADELPDGWSIARLSDPDIAMLNPKKSEQKGAPDETEVTFVPMSAVDEDTGTIARPEIRKLGVVRKGYTYFTEGDIIFAKITPCMENGKCAIARKLCNGVGFGSTEFHVVRAGQRALPEWLHLILRSKQVRDNAQNAMHGAAGQQRVPIEFLEQLEIPVPPLVEQRRLVARIDKLTSRIELARFARQASLNETEGLQTIAQRSEYERLLLEEDTIPLEKIGRVISGGTPSKSVGAFWGGDVPWIAPKEMKQFWISASSLNVTQRAVDDGTAKLVPEPAVLMVVRGMILAKRVPIAISTLPLAINQDMKAFVPRIGIDVVFLGHMLSGAAEELQTRVEVAGHGTCKLETSAWGPLPIPIPNPTEQRRIVTRLDTLATKQVDLRRLQIETVSELAAFTPALFAKAFRGEL